LRDEFKALSGAEQDAGVQNKMFGVNSKFIRPSKYICS